MTGTIVHIWNNASPNDDPYIHGAWGHDVTVSMLRKITDIAKHITTPNIGNGDIYVGLRCMVWYDEGEPPYGPSGFWDFEVVGYVLFDCITCEETIVDREDFEEMYGTKFDTLSGDE